MLKIRLQRVGRKNDPSFKVVLTDSRNGTKSGRFLEVLGVYNPKAGQVSFVTEKIKSCIAKGAQVSDTIHNMLVKDGLISGKKVNVLPKKQPTGKRKELKKAK